MNKAFFKHKNKTEAVIDQAILSGGGFALSILMARWLGLEVFGTYTVISIVIMLVNNFNHAFITSPLLTLRSRRRNATGYEKSLLSLQLLLTLAYAAVFALLAVLSEKWSPGFLSLADKGLFVACGIIYQLYDYYRKLQYARQNMRKALRMNTIVFTAQFSLLALLSSTGGLHFTSLLAVMACSYGISIPFLFVECSPAFHQKMLITIAGRHWRFSRWLLATTLAHWLSANYIFLAAGVILGVSSVGILRIGQTLIGSLTALYQVFENYLPPRVAQKLSDSDERNMWRYLFGIMGKAGVVIVVSAGIISLLADDLLVAFYGAGYLSQITVFRVFPLVAICIFPVYLLRIGVRTLEKNIHIFIACMLSIIFCVFGAEELIEKYQLMGAVTSLMLSQIVMIAWYLISMNTAVSRTASLKMLLLRGK